MNNFAYKEVEDGCISWWDWEADMAGVVGIPIMAYVNDAKIELIESRKASAIIADLKAWNETEFVCTDCGQPLVKMVMYPEHRFHWVCGCTVPEAREAAPTDVVSSESGKKSQQVPLRVGQAATVRDAIDEAYNAMVTDNLAKKPVPPRTIGWWLARIAKAAREETSV